MAKTLTGANQTTEWWDLRACKNGVCFTLTGDFATAVGIHYSNNDDYTKPTASLTVDDQTWSTKAGPLKFPAGIARYVRFFSSASWSAGTTCVPLFAPFIDPDGAVSVPDVQQVAS
jgi:hypothetical protein